MTLYELQQPDSGGDHPDIESAQGCYDVIFGDILDNIPEGRDAYLLKFVLHNWDDTRALRILKICQRAMSANAKLLIVATLLPEQPQQTIAFRHDVNMMVQTGGAVRSKTQFQTLLKSANLSLQKVVATPSGVSTLIANL